MDIDFMWIHYERLHNHNKAKHNKTVCIFLGIYCTEPEIIQYLHFAEDIFADIEMFVVQYPTNKVAD